MPTHACDGASWSINLYKRYVMSGCASWSTRQVQSIGRGSKKVRFTHEIPADCNGLKNQV